jgi:hypothetical protein
MRAFAATVAVLASGCASGVWGQQCQNFREAGVSRIYPAFVSLGQEYLATLSNATLPDDVRSARKHTLTLRDLLDVYSPVFSNSSTAGDDLWGQLRGFMDIGYTLLGDFQDLAHSGVNYTEVAPRFSHIH